MLYQTHTQSTCAEHADRLAARSGGINEMARSRNCNRIQCYMIGIQIVQTGKLGGTPVSGIVRQQDEGQRPSKAARLQCCNIFR